jgi:kynurenine formamidase
MKVGRIVDLSVPLGPGTAVYPGDPAPSLEPARTIDRDGYHVQHIRIGSHTGTHVDAPYHFARDGSRLDQLDLRLFAGPGVVVDATGVPLRAAIDWPVLAPYSPRLGPGVIVLLHTGSDAPDRAAGWLDHPFLGTDACRRLLDLGVRTICVDTMNIDAEPDPEPDYPVHRMMAAAGGVIGESFRNLGLVDFADPFVTCLPIALASGDGAPVRAVALELLP